MNKETEFEKWWARYGLVWYHSKTSLQVAWNAAWTCAKLGQLDRAKSEVRSEVQSQLMVIAVECFKAHDHERARFYQDLADEKHSIWNL